MLHSDELIGTIDRFLFQNTENGFCVAIISSKDASQPITVTGYLPGVYAGQQVMLTGAWSMHPRFGKQFEIKTYSTSIPTTTNGLKKYLASGLIKGIGPAYAERLVDHFGSHVLEIIDKNPERLREVPGIGPGRLATILNGWQDQKEVSAIMVFLQGKGVSSTYAMKIYKQYGLQAKAVLQENPYRLADDIWGIGFKTADTIAQAVGLSPLSIARIKAGILFAITTATNNGHLYCTVTQAKEQSLALLELTSEHESLLKHALHELYDAQKIKLITHNEQHYITLSQYYFCEKGVAQKIVTFLKSPVRIDFEASVIQAQLALQTTDNIQLNGDQQRGIVTCLTNKITIITGGPGTGKTTLLKKFLHVAKEHHLRVKLAAPTGRAAKRMSEGTGHHAMTIHRLLEYDPATHGFAHNEKNALELDVLVIDEASMIDIFLAHALLKAVPHHARIIFLGDIDQLPSVGAGNFLRDLIASTCVPCVRLTEIFRQAQDSLIIVNAHRVNNGEFPLQHAPESQRDFHIVKEDAQENVMEHIQALFGQLRARGWSTEDIMILCPLNRGGAGTQQLNHALQLFLNPTTVGATATYAGTTFKVHDRVMQIRNNYDKNIFNGDTGTISAIDSEEKTVHVLFAERTIVYEFSELDELMLAYAISIHKSQGSEYPVVIIPLFTAHFTMLARNLLYTAITRAKKRCILIGQTKAIAIAVKNKKSSERITFLQQFLTTDLACR